MYYYILALDEREYGPLDLPTLKAWMLEQRVGPATMLVDAKTRVTTTLGAVLHDVDPEFLTSANAMAFAASHQTCMVCHHVLPLDEKVCRNCGTMIPTPRSDMDGFGSALKTVGMVFGGVSVAAMLGVFFLLVAVFVGTFHPWLSGIMSRSRSGANPGAGRLRQIMTNYRRRMVKTLAGVLVLLLLICVAASFAFPSGMLPNIPKDAPMIGTPILCSGASDPASYAVALPVCNRSLDTLTASVKTIGAASDGSESSSGFGAPPGFYAGFVIANLSEHRTHTVTVVVDWHRGRQSGTRTFTIEPWRTSSNNPDTR